MTENEQRANEIATSIMHEGHIDKNGYNQRRDLERAALMMAETKDKEIAKLQQALSTVENNNIAILRKFDKYKMESDRAKADLRAELVKYKTAAFSDKQTTDPLTPEMLTAAGWENSFQYTAGGDKLKRQEKQIDDNRITILYHTHGSIHIFNNKSTMDISVKQITVGEFNKLLDIVKLEKFKINGH